MRFKRSFGLTESERLLADLCERSFLRLWTYPNLFKKPGNELVDLMVVFKDDLLLFSDKSCHFPRTGNPDLDWRRWFKNAIAHSSHQLQQAEHWIRSRPSEIFLDAKCSERLPLTLPSMDRARIHRLCVVTGAAERCAEKGLPGLGLDVSVTGAEMPFTVGRVRKDERTWLHVLDERSLSILLSELSTTKDFMDYLVAKIDLLKSETFRGAACEADLLGRYLWHGRTFPSEDVPYVVTSGLWEQLETNPAFLAGRRENAISMLWDRLIERFSEHFINSTLETGNELETSEFEPVVRIMAAESRLRRRVLSKAILQRAQTAKVQATPIATILPSEDPQVIYVTLIVPVMSDDYSSQRNIRKERLHMRCLAAKIVRPDTKYVLGIGLDAMGSNGSSEDFILIDTTGWDDDMFLYARSIREKLGLFMPGTVTESVQSEDEYPGGVNIVI